MKWIHQWYPQTLRAMHSFGSLFERHGGAAINSEGVFLQLEQTYNNFLRHAGLPSLSQGAAQLGAIGGAE